MTAGNSTTRNAHQTLPTLTKQPAERRGACLLCLLRGRRRRLQLLLQLLGAGPLGHQLLHHRHEVVALSHSGILLGLQGQMEAAGGQTGSGAGSEASRLGGAVLMSGTQHCCGSAVAATVMCPRGAADSVLVSGGGQSPRCTARAPASRGSQPARELTFFISSAARAFASASMRARAICVSAACLASRTAAREALTCATEETQRRRVQPD